MKVQVKIKSIGIAKVKKLINAHQWRFAKTLRKNPHEYTLMKTWNNKNDFIEFVKYICDHSYEGRFYSYKQRYCNIGEFKYWICEKDFDEFMQYILDGDEDDMLVNRTYIDGRKLKILLRKNPVEIADKKV